MNVKSVRFANVVESCGEPEPYLVLMDPAKDRTLQTAVKAQRVMTVFQAAVGTKADHRTIGFEPGPGRQFLIFPKSLREFAGRRVIGIKYDLLSSSEIPQSERAAPPEPPPKKGTPARKRKGAPPKPAPRKNVVAFKQEAAEDDEDEEIRDLKKQVRHAMAMLEEGRQVAAFNLLKRIVGD